MDCRILGSHIAIEHDNPNQFLAVFPQAKVAPFNGTYYGAVEHNLENAQILTNMGYEVESPIRSQYHWPGQYDPMDHQIDTAELCTLNKRCFILNAMRCVDAETEFLTPTGWKRIDQYQYGDFVAQWNPETEQAEFVTPTAYVSGPCAKMIHFKTSKGVDQMLTPNHRVLYKGSTGKYHVLTAQEVHDSNLRARTGWSGKLPVTFRAPDRTGICLSLAEIRVMVAVMADAHFPAGGAKNRCVVRLKKQRKKDRLRELLAEAAIAWKEREQNTATAQGFTVFTFSAPRQEKEFTPEWWGCTEEQLRGVVDEAPHWDGSLRKAGAFAFSTTVKASADFIQYAAAATGHKASLNLNTRERRGRVEIEYCVHVEAVGGYRGIQSVSSEGEKYQTSFEVDAPGGMYYGFTVPSSFLVMRRNNCVFVTGNTGKTLSVLWAADYLKQLGLIRKVLILAPLSTLTDVWANNLFYSFHHHRHAVLYGDAMKRKTLLKKDHDFYILNHDGIAVVEEVLKQRHDIDLIILDESAVFRNARTGRWKMLKKLIRPDMWVWGLTGTPTPNTPTDAYAQMKLIRPENYPHSFTDFKNLVMQPVGTFKWVPKKFVNVVINGVHCTSGEAVVNQILKPSIRIPRSVCSAREPIVTSRFAELSPTQKKHYNDLFKECVTDIEGTAINAVNAAVLAQKLIQVSIGGAYDSDKEWVNIDLGPRIKLAEDLIEENDAKVLVFVPFTGALKAVAKELSKRWSVEIVDGSVSAGKRNKIFQDFRNTPNPHVIVAHPKTMAHGLDLTSASCILWYSPFYDNELYQQANARLDGVKQTRDVDIVRIYGTKLEQSVYAVLDGKESIQQAILDLARGKC